MGYTVLKDTREQQGWFFVKSPNCDGTVEATLSTGDYTLLEYRDILCIERKGSSGEFARNIVEHRFEEELKRMQEIVYPFIVLEFTMNDIINFPRNSGIPPTLWSKLRISPFFLLKRFMEFQYKYKAKIILAGSHGKDVASSIFKRMIEHDEERKSKKRARKDTATC